MTVDLSEPERSVVERLADDLVRVFGSRLQVIVAYRHIPAPSGDSALHTLALVDRVATEDLSALLTLVPAWHKTNLATPLLLAQEEFERTLDVFPLEYESILSDHVVIRGAWSGRLQVGAADLRRACERQIKAHLIHLREGFLETHGRPSHVASLLRASVAPFRATLKQAAKLENAPAATDNDLVNFARSIDVDAMAVRDVLADLESGADATALLARYINATGQLWRAVDRR